jgi:hypothetical protein
LQQVEQVIEGDSQVQGGGGLVSKAQSSALAANNTHCKLLIKVTLNDINI